MLVMGNQKSKYSFWDLQKLEQGLDAKETATARRSSSKRGRGRGGGTTGRGSKTALSALGRDAQAQALADETSVSIGAEEASIGRQSETPASRMDSTPAVSHGSGPMRTGNAVLDAKFDPSDPFRHIPPHHTVTVPKYNFGTRQCAWSNDGRWLVGVGHIGLIVVMKRW